MCVCFFVIRIGIRFTLKMQILSEYGIIQDRKGRDSMGLAEFERKRDEKINGEIFEGVE